MIYNSYSYDYAFSGIDFIEFNLAEKPTWFTGEEYVPVARISNIAFDDSFISSTYQAVQSGASCMASFREMKVNSITISVSEKIAKGNESIRLSDIVVLGN
jgi:hypothetical protein